MKKVKWDSTAAGYMQYLQQRYDSRHRQVPWWKRKVTAIIVKIRGW